MNKGEQWVPVYLCSMCGKKVTHVPVYNSYGASQFPQVDAAEAIVHRCSPDEMGTATLIGLRRLGGS